MKPIKTILSCILLLALLITSVPAVQAAVDSDIPSQTMEPSIHTVTTSGVWNDDITWSFQESTGILRIEGSGDMQEYYGTDAPCADYLQAIEIVEIGPGITTVDENLFSSDTYYKNVRQYLVDDNNPNYADDQGVLYNKDMTELLRIPMNYQSAYAVVNGVTCIYEDQVFGCRNVTALTIPASVTDVSFVWGTMEKLEKFLVDENNPKYTADGNGVLYNKDFTRVERVPWAFQGEFTVPESVVRLFPDYSLRGCHQMTGISIGAAASDLDDWGEWNYFYCKSLAYIRVDENNPLFCSDEYGVLYNKDKTTLLRIPMAFQGDYAIPEGVTQIECCAADGCTGLTGITLPETLTTIGQYSFYQCTGLREVTFPASLTACGWFMFDGCTGITKMTFHCDATAWYQNSFGHGMFGDINAVAYYPQDDDTWTQPVLTNTYHGGNLTWIPLENQSVAPELDLQYPAVSFEDQVVIDVFFQAENREDVTQMGLISFRQEVASWRVENAEYVTSGYTIDEQTGICHVSSQGIAPHLLGQELYIAVYCKLADGSYTYSDLVSYSPVSYAYNILRNAATPTQMKTLAAAMLDYGAAAQCYFGVDTDQLINADMTASEQSLVAAYNTNMVQPVGSVSTSKTGVFANNGGFSKRYPNITLDGAFSINYFFTPACTPSGDVTLYYWSEADYVSCGLLTAENASGALVMAGDGELFASVRDIAAKDLDSTVYVAAIYTDEAGNTWASGVLPYSIGAYCQAQANTSTGAMQALAQATAVYSYYAKQLFA